jgi:hypothetical protein
MGTKTTKVGRRSMLTSLRQVRNEIAVLKRVSMGHQNILTLVDYFETMNNCTPHLSLRQENTSIDTNSCTQYT